MEGGIPALIRRCASWLVIEEMLPTPFQFAADFVVLVHTAFVLFVVVGGVLVARWPRLAWLHLPAVAWGALIEFTGWICPLTPLENYFRQRAGSSIYEGDFIEHYLFPVLYPTELTRTRQTWFGVLAIVVNLCVYAYVVRRTQSRSASSGDEFS